MSIPALDVDFTAMLEREPCAYRRVWASALAVLLEDGRAAWRGGGYRAGATRRELREAFDDLVGCGPGLRNICDWLDIDPEWISASFVRWCERN